MGLESFETDGPRTRSSGKSKRTKQKALRTSDFEEEWGRPMVEAAKDDEFIKQRLKEGYGITELCDEFHWIEHTVISRLAEMVDNGVIGIEEVPESTHMDYNDKPISHYIEERNKSKPFSAKIDNNSSSSDSSSGLDSFRT